MLNVCTGSSAHKRSQRKHSCSGFFEVFILRIYNIDLNVQFVGAIQGECKHSPEKRFYASIRNACVAVNSLYWSCIVLILMIFYRKLK